MLTLLATLAGCASLTPGCDGCGRRGPPDIALIVVDTFRADRVGVLGSKRPTTPNLDAFAARGTLFTRAYSQSGWTLPSFTSLFTGLYPHQHRVGRDAVDPSRFSRLGGSIPTLALSLSEAGYATAAIANNTFLAPEFALKRGFDSYDWVGATNAEHRSDDASLDAGLAWLVDHDGPSFAMIHLMQPHLDYDPPQDLRGTFAPIEDPPVSVPFGSGPEPLTRWMYGLARPTPEQAGYIERLYDEEILATDRAIGRFLERLDESGEAEHTVVIVTADHGEEFWDHDKFEHGTSLFAELTHVPLIMAGPGVPQGAVVRTVVEHVDLFQGILALAGAKAPGGTAGQDLLAVAARGEYLPGRTALSENVLYGGGQASLVTDEARIVLSWLEAQPRLTIWAVDPEDANELQPLPADRQIAVGRQLAPLLVSRRGSLDRGVPLEGMEIDQEVFGQLESQGYLQ